MEIKPINSSPKDGTPVLLKFKSDLSQFDFRSNWEGKLFVGRNHGGSGMMGWGFAAPVGCGGFPDDCFEGWYNLDGL
jgi:hypothetical protein